MKIQEEYLTIGESPHRAYLEPLNLKNKAVHKNKDDNIHRRSENVGHQHL